MFELVVFLSGIFILLCSGVFSDCPNDNVVDFTIVPKDQYDMNFTQINTDGKRPYGFSKSIWLYNAPDSQNPCLHITGAAGRFVEVMVETEPPARLCLKTDDDSTPICFNGQVWRCFRAQANNFSVEIFCDNQCSESSVPFWFRLKTGPTTAEDPEEYWCDEQSRDEYPSNLQQLPSDFFIPTSSTDSPGMAHKLGPSMLPCAFLALLSSALWWW